VWNAYKLSANDVGIMLDSVAPMQTGNRNLRERPVKQIRSALDAMIRAGLLVRFTHQDESYVCSPKWQDWQRVEYPRQTHLPLPAGDVREQCSEATRMLFAKLEENRQQQAERIKNGRKKSRVTSEDLPVSGEDSIPHARDRAGNANANANAGVDRGESERGLVLVPGQAKSGVSSLVSIWNSRAVEPFVRVTDKLAPVSAARVEAALKAHPDLDWWDQRFVEVTTSTFCRGGGDRGWVADFWWVLENADTIATGRYRDRAIVPKTKVQAVTQEALARVLAREMPS
jgi:hypothetical protein